MRIFFFGNESLDFCFWYDFIKDNSTDTDWIVVKRRRKEVDHIIREAAIALGRKIVPSPDPVKEAEYTFVVYNKNDFEVYTNKNKNLSLVISNTENVTQEAPISEGV